MDEFASAVRCPRCRSRRIPGKDRCAKCDWRFEIPPPAPPEPEVGTPDRPMQVELRPDPFARRQVSRWLLGVFEVLVVSGLVGAVSGWIGATLAGELSRLLRNDPGASMLVGVLWFVTFAITGAWLTLRYMAR